MKVKQERRVAILPVIIVAGVAALFGASTSVSSTPVIAASSYFPRVYTSDANMAFGSRASAFTSSTAEASLHTGDDGWDSVSENWFDWGWQGEFDTVAWTGGACATAPTNGVHYLVTTGTFSGSGVTNLCTSGSTILRGVTRFDHSEPWNFGSGTPGAGQTDLRSLVVHEMGHAAGWVGHLASPCGFVDYQATMCATPYGGQTWWRSLQSYDTTQIAAAY